MNVSILIKYQHPAGTSVSTARKRSLGQGNVFTGVCLSTGGLCPSMHQRSLDQGVCPGGLCTGVSVQGGLCPGGISVQGVSVWGYLSREGLCQGDPLDRDPPCMVTSRQYASYWNAFLFMSKNDSNSKFGLSPSMQVHGDFSFFKSCRLY